MTIRCKISIILLRDDVGIVPYRLVQNVKFTSTSVITNIIQPGTLMHGNI